MDEMELACAVYGDGTVVRVKIARDADVESLENAIVADQRFRERFSCPPRRLTLYLARKDGVWLKDNDLLRDGTIDSEYKELRTSWKLSKPELLGPDFQVGGNNEIHILAELPPANRIVARAADMASLAATMKKQVAEIHEVLVRNKRKRYDCSELDTLQVNTLLQDLRIRVTLVHSIPFVTAANPTPVEAFTWESEHGNDEQQRERYRAYMETNIGDVLVEKRLCVLSVDKENNILSTAVPGHNVDLVGRADMLILSDLAKTCPIHLMFLPEAKMLIEVKKNVEACSLHQVVTELIALDVQVMDPVMALLTDLTGHWQFFWVSEKSGTHAIIQTVLLTDPSAAFAVIRAVLAHAPAPADADTSIQLPCLDRPVKRRKLSQFLTTISEGDGEGSSIRGALERYYDIASVLGPDVEMARATAKQIVRTIPAFRDYT